MNDLARTVQAWKAKLREAQPREAPIIDDIPLEAIMPKPAKLATIVQITPAQARARRKGDTILAIEPITPKARHALKMSHDHSKARDTPSLASPTVLAASASLAAIIQSMAGFDPARKCKPLRRKS